MRIEHPFSKRRTPVILALACAALLLLAFAGTASAKSGKPGSRATKTITWTKSLPTPTGSTFAGGGSDGDGYDVFFDDAGNVFNVWHHDGNGGTGAGGAVDCHTRSGATCGAGWPFKVAPLHTDSISTGWVDNENGHLWFPTNTDDGSVGFACLDIATVSAPAWCGGSSDAAFRNLGAVTFASSGSCTTERKYDCVKGASAIGGKLYTLDKDGKILCLEPAAASGVGAACKGQPFSSPSGPWKQEFASGGRLYLLGSDTAGALTASCFDPATGAACAGWESPKAATGSFKMFGSLIYTLPSADGTATGICFGATTCFKRDGSSLPSDPGFVGAYNAAPLTSEFTGTIASNGSQIYWGFNVIRGQTGSLNCFDVATGAGCPGYPIASVSGYSIVPDPYNDTCVWANGDDGKIISYSANGQAGCVMTPTTTRFYPSVPCSQGTVSSWTSFALTGPAASAYSSAKLTIRTADGTAVKSGGKTWENLAITGARTISLSGLSAADTGQDPTFAVKFAGRSGTDNVASTVKFSITTGDACGKSGGGSKPKPAPTVSPIKAKAKAVSKQVPAGGTFSIKLTARNSGKTASKKTRIVFPAPKGFVIVSAAGAKITGGGRTATWDIGTLKAGKTASGTVVLRALPETKGRKSMGFTVYSSLGNATATAASVWVTGNSPVTG